MLTNKSINVNDIKSTIPRYDLSYFKMVSTDLGNYVRYCDHTQAIATEKKKYEALLKRIEVLQEQLAFATDSSEIFQKKAIAAQKDSEYYLISWTKQMKLTILVTAISTLLAVYIISFQ